MGDAGGSFTETRTRQGLRLINFLNSPLGLLLLSSVVIGGLGKVYTDTRDRAEKESTTQQECMKLAAEFVHRLTYVTESSRRIRNASSNPGEAQQQSVLLWRAVVGDREFMPSLPEFKETHWGGIVSRMRVLGFEVPEEVRTAIYELDLARDEGWQYDLSKLDRNISVISDFARDYALSGPIVRSTRLRSEPQGL